MFDIDSISPDFPDKEVYKMLGEGKTKGVFQLETELGASNCKQLKPENIEHLSALGAILRPGCLESLDKDGVSTTRHYIRRKNGEEECIPPHPCLEPILGESYQTLIYQEQMIRIVRDIGKFTASEADTMRKAVGKKDQELITKVGKQFIEGCEKAKTISAQDATDIYDLIKAAGRYSFNKSIDGNTEVITKQGRKKIKDTIVGDLVLAPKDDLSGDEFVEVLNKYDHGILPVYRVYFDSGTYVDCTREHKFLTQELNKCTVEEIQYANIGVITRNGNIEGITGVEYLGELQTYDLEVNNDRHVYYQNDIAGENSHSVVYGIIGYKTAYLKRYFTLPFFRSWLYFAREKMNPRDEIRELVDEAKLFDIEVIGPSLLRLKMRFGDDGEKIFFGISDIKGIGKNQYLKIKEVVQGLLKPINEISWYEFVITAATKIQKDAVEALIKVGAMPFSETRTKMLLDYKNISELTDKELAWCQLHINEYSNLSDLLDSCAKPKKDGGGASNKNRIEIIKGISESIRNPASSIKDSPIWISIVEEELLGIPITYFKVDGKNTMAVNCSCKNYLKNERSKDIILGVEVVKVKEHKIKQGTSRGKPMAFLTVTDGSAKLNDVTVFTDVYLESKDLLTEGSTVLLIGDRSNRGGLLVRKVIELK